MIKQHDDLAFIMGEVYGEWLESDETSIQVWVTENYMGDAEYKRAIQTAHRIFTEDIL